MARHGGRARPPGAVRPRAGLLPEGHPRGSRPDRVRWTPPSTACASCSPPSRASTRGGRSSCSRGRRARHPGGDNGQGRVGAGQFRPPPGCDSRRTGKAGGGTAGRGRGNHGHSLAHDPSRVHGGGLAAAAAPFWLSGRAPRAQQATEIVHWSWLAASDGEVWQKMIEGFNDAHAGKGVQIKMEVVPEEQYVTKVLAAAATGRRPTSAGAPPGSAPRWPRTASSVPLDDLAKQAGPRPRRLRPRSR